MTPAREFELWMFHEEMKEMSPELGEWSEQVVDLMLCMSLPEGFLADLIKAGNDLKAKR